MSTATKFTKATDLILENLLDAVLVVDAAGSIIYANRSAQELLERPMDQLLGAPFGYPAIPGEVQEIQIIKQGSPLTVQMLASSIEWDGRNASLLSLRDITEIKKVNEALLSYQNQLERMNEENAHFAYMASHDLSAPVRKVHFFTEQLLKEDSLKQQARLQLQKIMNSALRMQSIIAGISALSKVTHVRHIFEPVDLNQIMEEVIQDLELVIEEKQAHVLWEQLPRLEAVPTEMYQLFSNLIANGLKYAKVGQQPLITLRGTCPGEGWVQIDCRDNGIGFSNEDAHLLFRPFQRLHPAEYEGIGMGLALCQKIVEAHNGEIRAQGKEGEGAQFSIRLPVSQSSL